MKRYSQWIGSILLLGFSLNTAWAAENTPSVEEIQERYTQAVGGREAFGRCRTRLMKGTLEWVGEGTTQTIEIAFQIPGQFYRSVSTLDGPMVQVLAGEKGWVQNPGEPTHEAVGAELDRLKRQMLFQGQLDLKRAFSRVSVTGKGTVGQHPVWIVEAVPAEGEHERFLFDAASGLLLQHESTPEIWGEKTLVVASLEDYRDVDGVKLPFTIRQTGDDLTIHFKEIRHNVPIDEGKFAKPPS